MRLGLGLGLTHNALSAPPALLISGTPVAAATEGTAYTGFIVTASGGTAPYTYSLVGTWPAGISVDASTGAVSGTPAENGSFAGLSVRVTDATSDTADMETFDLTVAAGEAALSYAFTGYYSSLANGNPSFASVDFGTAPTGSSTRHILVMKGRTSTGASSQPVSTAVSIGGVSATLINSQSINFGCIEAWIAEVPTSTSGTVAFTSGGNRHGMAVYKIDNLSSIGAITSDVDTTAAVSLSMLAGEIVIAGAVRVVVAALTMTGVSEDANDSPGTVSRFVMGSQLQTGAGTVTVDTDATSNRAIMMVGVS